MAFRSVVLGATAVAVMASVDMTPVFAQGIEEIVVTARKREESLQSVPVAVTAFSELEMKLQTTQTIADLEKTTPSLTFRRDLGISNSSSMTLRGQTQRASLINGDPAVGLYADGVYIARNPGMITSMVDIERIEVLKGPQGTLYGRNTSGGAVNIITKKPVIGEYSGFANVLFGNYSRNDYTAGINVPLTDIGALRIVAQGSNMDGYTKNVFDNSELDDDEEFAVRGSMLFEPNENTQIIIRGDYMTARESGYGEKLIFVNPAPGTPGFNIRDHAVQGSSAVVTLLTGGQVGCNAGLAGILPVGAGGCDAAPPAGTIPLTTTVAGSQSLSDFLALPNHTVDSGFFNPATEGVFWLGAGYAQDDNIDGFSRRVDGFSEIDIWGASIDVTHDFDGIEAKFITSYREMDSTVNTDIDGTPFPILNALLRAGQHQFSAELNVSGVDEILGNDLDWVMGAFYMREKGSNQSDTFAFGPVNPATPSRLRGQATNTSVAGFVHGVYSLSEDLSLTGGVRYTRDRKRLRSEDLGRAGGANLIIATICDVPAVRRIDGMCLALTDDKFDAISYTASLDYQLFDDANKSMMVYGKVARGFRSGGQNLRTVLADDADQAFDAETVLSYEAGFKSEWFDSRLRVNAAYFYQDYNDIQQILIISTGGGLSTVISNAAKATIQGGEVEVLVEPFQNFTLAANVSALDPEYDEFTDALGNDRTDEEFLSSPGWTYSLAGTYVHPVSYGDWTMRAGYAWQAEEHFGIRDTVTGVTQEPVGLVDARIALELPDYNLELAVWGKNLTDKYKLTNTVDLTGSQGHAVGAYEPPRTYGGEITWRWGGDMAPVKRASARAPAAPMGCDAKNFLVFFDWDRSNLTGLAADIVNQAAAHINAGCSATIDVTGHTDASGGNQYNLGLSKKRADAVAQALVNQGVSAGQIMVNWKGESEPLVSTNDGVREPQNRRVEINVKG